jgi:hypothetical protein
VPELLECITMHGFHSAIFNVLMTEEFEEAYPENF